MGVPLISSSCSSSSLLNLASFLTTAHEFPSIFIPNFCCNSLRSAGFHPIVLLERISCTVAEYHLSSEYPCCYLKLECFSSMSTSL